MNAPRCACARNVDGTVTAMLCPVHAATDPCATVAAVTGRRRTGTIRRGVCTACGHGGAAPGQVVHLHAAGPVDGVPAGRCACVCGVPCGGRDVTAYAGLDPERVTCPDCLAGAR